MKRMKRTDMKNLIVYVYRELFEEELDPSSWMLIKASPDEFADDLRQEFISYWRNRLKQEPSYRGISLVLVSVGADGNPDMELLYKEVLPAKKKVIINPVATEKNKLMGGKKTESSNSFEINWTTGAMPSSFEVVGTVET